MACARPALVPASPAEGLVVPPALASRWGALAPSIRDHVSTFLAPDARARGRMATIRNDLVREPFREDLSRGAPLLRAAFPHLERRLAVIAAGPALTIRIHCEGSHEGVFYGLLLPTCRRVRFDEVHELTLDGVRITEDRLAIDFPAIIRDLSTLVVRA